MNLFIKKSINELYDLVHVVPGMQTCLLQDTLENCLSKFKETIDKHNPKIDVIYSYDASNHLVMDYSSGKIKCINAEDFINK